MIQYQYLNIYSPQVWPEFSRTLYSRSPLSNPSTSPSTADAGLRGEVTKRRRRLRPQLPSSPAPWSVSRRNWSAVLPPGALRGSKERGRNEKTVFMMWCRCRERHEGTDRIAEDAAHLSNIGYSSSLRSRMEFHPQRNDRWFLSLPSNELGSRLPLKPRFGLGGLRTCNTFFQKTTGLL